MNGGPVAISWAAQHVPAIIDAWYGGTQAGTAISNALFGATVPAGRLPFSVVKGVEDLPDELDMSPIAAPFGRTYRYFNSTPLYNFGFGLR